jgi:hypothetical protein
MYLSIYIYTLYVYKRFIYIYAYIYVYIYAYIYIYIYIYSFRMSKKGSKRIQSSVGSAVGTGRELIQTQQDSVGDQKHCVLNSRHRALQDAELSNAGPDRWPF